MYQQVGATVIEGIKSNAIYVSSLNGNDRTDGADDVPFLTIGAAINAASSGQTVIVLPGTYNETITSKDGLTVHFMPGAKIVKTGSISTNIFTVESGITFNVTGHGEFICLLEGANGLAVNHASANVYFECRRMEFGDGTTGVGVQCNSGNLTLKVEKDITAHGYDALILGNGTSYVNVGSLIATSDADVDSNSLELGGTGTHYITCDLMQSDGTALNWTGGSAFINCKDIVSAADAGLYTGTTTSGTVRINDARIKSTLTNSSAVRYETGTANKILYLNNCTIVAHSGATNGVTAPGAQSVFVLGGLLTNKAKHANITYVGGTETVNSGVA